ncbi:hypothetical protein GBZ26_06840 [Azospirillum formosense]|uniref:Uncharacterized protein n=1 Tax=Azospirillum formosense TaxID=861533 RepID=A0ABX2KZE6_9PROT|nr:hypothetical protein [Azospirillum formosense]MBY3752583.1 hypothetical protein [Azospirillum formosense]NUB18928.1 hypothetical protein [Azospirillum formosense]
MHTLLYTDKLHAIVPFNYMENPNKYEEFMQSLIREGLVEQHFVNIPHQKTRDFAAGFLAVLRAHGLPSHSFYKANTSRERQIAIRSANLKFPGAVHSEKMISSELNETLIEMGLAFKSMPKWNYWYHMEEMTARLYMSYLAQYICALSETPISPITNELKNMELLSKQGRKQRSTAVKSHLRRCLIEGILPTWNGPIDLYEIKNFKDKNQYLLHSFRRNIESLIDELYNNGSPSERRVSDARDKLREDTNKIKESLVKKFLKPVMLSTLGTILAAPEPTLNLYSEITKSGLSSGHILPAITVAGAALAAAGALPTLFERERSPLAYAVLANRRFQARPQSAFDITAL